MILMHEIDPSAYVAQHENYFSTCNTNTSLQNKKSCPSLPNKILVEQTFYMQCIACLYCL